MSRVASRMARLGTETAMAISVEAAAHAAAGNRVFPFHLGDLNLPTPAPVREAARAALEAGHTGYCPAAGIPPLREALATDVGGARGLDYGGANVSVQPGGKPTIGKYIAAVMEEGETVLYPNPGYPIYESQIEFYGGGAHPYGYIDTPDGLRLDFDAIEAGIAAGARHLFYNNYNNPTGASSPPAEMERLAQLTVEHDLLVVSDEAYFDMLFDGDPRSIASLPGMRERTLILYTFSKKFAMTGWRLGGAIGPRWLTDEISRLNVNAESCTAHFVQHAGVAALGLAVGETDAIRDRLRARRDRLATLLNEIDGVAAHLPEAGFYFFPRVTELMARTGFDDAEAFRQAVLDATGVSFCCRYHFGRPLEGEREHYLRFAFSGISLADLEEGMTRLTEWANSR